MSGGVDAPLRRAADNGHEYDDDQITSLEVSPSLAVSGESGKGHVKMSGGVDARLRRAADSGCEYDEGQTASPEVSPSLAVSGESGKGT